MNWGIAANIAEVVTSISLVIAIIQLINIFHKSSLVRQGKKSELSCLKKIMSSGRKKIKNRQIGCVQAMIKPEY